MIFTPFLAPLPAYRQAGLIRREMLAVRLIKGKDNCIKPKS